jgi:hypothetical protein
MGLIYETSVWPFLFVTVIAGGGAAFMLGRAVAKGWNPLWQAILAVLPLAAVVRFLHWGLFAGATLASWREVQGSLVSLHYYVADALVLLVFAVIGFYLQRRAQMLRQYRWLAAPAGPLGWKMASSATTQPQSQGTS